MPNTREYDVVVIGSGPAGGTVAPKCHSAGLKVAVVESDDYGGTCPNRGCNPKKVLVGAAEVISRASEMREKGIWGKVTIDWPELMRFKRRFTQPVSEQTKRGLESSGIDTFSGSARFTGKNTIQAGDETITGKHIVIATGLVPRKLDIPGQEHIVSSDGFLELEHMPPSVSFIGASFISFEFAHVAARVGSRSVLLEMGDMPLPMFEQDIVKVLLEASKELGIDVQTNMKVNNIEKNGDTFNVRAVDEISHTFESDLVVHGAGRVSNIENLALEEAGVKTSEKGIVVNKYMQSVSNPSVYAAGDAAATPLALTPVANMEAEVAARNIIKGNSTKADHTGIPSVVFTVPPLASVGMLERELQENGPSYEVKHYDTSSWFSSERIGLKHSAAKLLIARKSKRILGAHLFGEHAEEVINVFAMAVRLCLTAHDLKKMVWAYPSSVSDVRYML